MSAIGIMFGSLTPGPDCKKRKSFTIGLARQTYGTVIVDRDNFCSCRSVRDKPTK